MSSILTKKHLHRRTFLKGMGAALSLPLLDAMIPAATASAKTAAPIRLGFVYVPNGVIMDSWTPAADGTAFELPRTLAPLEKLRSDIFIATELAHQNARALGDGGGDHARASAAFLTGVHPNKTAGADIRNGVSVDQLAALHLGQFTRYPSLELTVEPGKLAGNCDSGYSCAYSNSISWRTETQPNPAEGNPRAVFERLFGGEDKKLSPEARAKRMHYRGSVLDVVLDQARTLQGNLGPSDRRKLEEYLHAVRLIERQIEWNEKHANDADVTLDVPESAPKNYAEYARLMFELQLLAYQTDQVRVATFMMAKEGSNRAYREVEVSGGHHELSHHLKDEAKIQNLREINRYHMEQFAWFLDRMKNTPDGDGSLLDHSAIVYGSGISDGNAHNHDDLPVLVAGRASGQITPGRHVRYAKETPMTNLYLNLLEYAGCPTDTLGDSNGKLNYLSDMTA